MFSGSCPDGAVFPSLSAKATNRGAKSTIELGFLAVLPCVQECPMPFITDSPRGSRPGLSTGMARPPEAEDGASPALVIDQIHKAI